MKIIKDGSIRKEEETKLWTFLQVMTVKNSSEINDNTTWVALLDRRMAGSKSSSSHQENYVEIMHMFCNLKVGTH